jgi:hypothetical protein
MPSTRDRRRENPIAGAQTGPDPGDERKTTAPPPSRLRRPGPLDAGPFAADVASFELHLVAENKAPGTIRIYTEAPPVRRRRPAA